ncbi:hypothetical protein Tco_1385188 [Tanacetum coccineum]
MSNLKVANTYNLVVFLSKPAESEGFEQIVDFLNAQPIRHALTVNPTIYTSCIEQFWATVKVKTVNDEVQLHTLVDGKKIIINGSTVRRDLQLEDAKGINCLPNATIFEQLALIGPKKKDTQVPQSSIPSDNVVDEDVYKELDDSLVRATTTASSLEAECQETIGDTISQTRFENVSKLSNDPLLAKGNTLRSEIKKLENKNKSRTHKLKIPYKVGLSARVESSRDEEVLGKDASKQERRIHDIDADEDITLVNDDNEIFDVDALASEEVFVAEQSGNIVEEVVDVIDAASTIPVSAATITDVEITLAQALAELKSAKPKANKLAQRLQAQEQEELTDEEKARLFVQFLEQRRKYFAAKRAEEKRNRPPTRAQQRNIMCTYLKNLEGWKPKSLKNKSFANIQELFEKSMKRVNTFIDYRTELVEESYKKAEIKLE